MDTKVSSSLIPIDYSNNERPTVLGRDLHAALDINEKYTEWFKRMLEYGFVENVDFVVFLEHRKYGNEQTVEGFTPLSKPRTNHQLTLDMAKHIAMVQRTPIGMKIRQYFIEVEQKHRRNLLITNDPINHAIVVSGERAQLAAKYFGVEIGMARIHAMNEVEDELGVSLESWKKFLPPSQDYDIPTLTPTAIASIIKEETGKPYSAQKVNQLLLKNEYQMKPDKEWLIAEKGKPYANMVPFDNKTTGHAGYQLKWKVTIMDVIRDLLK